MGHKKDAGVSIRLNSSPAPLFLALCLSVCPRSSLCILSETAVVELCDESDPIKADVQENGTQRRGAAFHIQNLQENTKQTTQGGSGDQV